MSRDARLIDVVLDEKSVVRRNADVEHERAVAIFDLLEDNFFDPLTVDDGPYALVLSVEDNRLIFDIQSADQQRALARVPMPTAPFRGIIKDYFTVCESYFAAIKTASPSQIEAIDMGRRGLHNEASEQLREQLAGKIEIDFNTARRLFTLLCVLHARG